MSSRYHEHLIGARKSGHDSTYIYLPSLKPLLQVLVDCFIGDFAQKSEVGHSHLFLLCYLERCFLDVWLASVAAGSVSPTTEY